MRQRQHTSIFSRVGFEVTDKEGKNHRHYYRDYHLLTPVWKTISIEALASLERLRQSFFVKKLVA
jgi:hypothetical protein